MGLEPTTLCLGRLLALRRIDLNPKKRILDRLGPLPPSDGSTDFHLRKPVLKSRRACAAGFFLSGQPCLTV